MNSIERLPLFPLPTHVLPGGILPLRIFEPRYLRMIKEALASNSYFGMCMTNPDGKEEDNSHIHRIGTLVKVTDFEPLDDGHLGITTHGLQTFTINHIDTEADLLKVGQVNLNDNWPELALQEQHLFLSDELEKVFMQFPDIASLYTKAEWENANWVASRWLEILPLKAQLKQDFLARPTAEEAISYLVKSFGNKTHH